MWRMPGLITIKSQEQSLLTHFKFYIKYSVTVAAGYKLHSILLISRITSSGIKDLLWDIADTNVVTSSIPLKSYIKGQ